MALTCGTELLPGSHGSGEVGVEMISVDRRKTGGGRSKKERILGVGTLERGVRVERGRRTPFGGRKAVKGRLGCRQLGFWLSTGFWPKATLASTLGRLSGVSVQTWMPTLTPASSDMDANFSDLHALQSQKIREQGMASIGGMSPNDSQLVKSIFCIKEEAEAKGKDSPSSPRRGDHPGAPRKAILEALLQLLGTAQGAMASRGRRGGVPARDDEQRREERAEQ
ncbi:hypothetical protein Taro_008313 [Colocasia esculenta]|uniref:Uncharacterized protein n=1 Tax=Colocasia esculenta TaxID=4460 RepID=A0A843U302_COLES|nr:hypothetical protein [Colocasia esculenta]